MIQALSLLNMVLILWAVWLLGGGTRMRFGNWIMLFACLTGAFLAGQLFLWPWLALNIILYLRTIWLLKKEDSITFQSQCKDGDTCLEYMEKSFEAGMGRKAGAREND